METIDGLFYWFLEDLKKLRKGETSPPFSELIHFIDHAIPNFPKEKQAEIEQIITYAVEEQNYIRALRTSEALEGSADERRSAIDAFIEKYQKYK